jgi:hypothetical protein
MFPNIGSQIASKPCYSGIKRINPLYKNNDTTISNKNIANETSNWTSYGPEADQQLPVLIPLPIPALSNIPYISSTYTNCCNKSTKKYFNRVQSNLAADFHDNSLSSTEILLQPIKLETIFSATELDTSKSANEFRSNQALDVEKKETETKNKDSVKQHDVNNPIQFTEEQENEDNTEKIFPKKEATNNPNSEIFFLTESTNNESKAQLEPKKNSKTTTLDYKKLTDQIFQSQTKISSLKAKNSINSSNSQSVDKLLETFKSKYLKINDEQVYRINDKLVKSDAEIKAIKFHERGESNLFNIAICKYFNIY